jgi:COMPASS component SPP1
MIHERAKLAAKHMGNKDDKGICGYDSRLAFNDVQFLKWYDSKEGQMAFATNVLGPRTEETKEINARIPAPGQAVPAVSEAPDALKDICLLPPRKCKHWGWREIHNQDFTESQQNLRKELRKLEKQVDEVIDDAETREATKAHYADNVAIQLF